MTYHLQNRIQSYKNFSLFCRRNKNNNIDYVLGLDPEYSQV